jgi:hypothetical protein
MPLLPTGTAPAPAEHAPVGQTTLPGFSPDTAAAGLRQKTLQLALDHLRGAGGLTGREIAQQLAYVDRRIDRHLVNSVLSREGVAMVVHEPMTGKYRLKPQQR